MGEMDCYGSEEASLYHLLVLVCPVPALSSSPYPSHRASYSNLNHPCPLTTATRCCVLVDLIFFAELFANFLEC